MFDVVVARAVADLATLARFAYPLLKRGGRLIAMKGPNPDDELRKCPHPSWPMRIERYRLPEGLGERTLVILWTNGRERAG
jgi:16S rRNA (guanine527-N7)-methyltransferase